MRAPTAIQDASVSSKNQGNGFLTLPNKCLDRKLHTYDCLRPPARPMCKTPNSTSNNAEEKSQLLNIVICKPQKAKRTLPKQQVPQERSPFCATAPSSWQPPSP